MTMMFIVKTSNFGGGGDTGEEFQSICNFKNVPAADDGVVINPYLQSVLRKKIVSRLQRLIKIEMEYGYRARIEKKMATFVKKYFPKHHHIRRVSVIYG